MERLIFINSRGESITLGKSPPYILQTIEGLGGPSTDVQMQKSPFQDGQVYLDTLLEERTIDFDVAILANTPEELYQRRAELVRVFNAKLGPGILRYEYYGNVREIEATVETAPIFPAGSGSKGYTFQIARFSLVCPSPFWLDPLEQNIKLEDFVSNFRFPFHFPVIFSTRGDTRTIINDGDVPTPIIVEFRGPATNPRIENNTTGEFIQVNREVPVNYRLIINTEFGRKRVSIIAPDGVETNAFHYLDLDSTFFGLEVGENRLSFITAGGRPEVYIRFKKRYTGV